MKIYSIITAQGETFFSRDKGIQNPEWRLGYCYDVCYIKKLWFGLYQVDYYDPHFVTGGFSKETNQTPNTRLILYPSGIKQVRYISEK